MSKPIFGLLVQYQGPDDNHPNVRYYTQGMNIFTGTQTLLFDTLRIFHTDGLVTLLPADGVEKVEFFKK